MGRRERERMMTWRGTGEEGKDARRIVGRQPKTHETVERLG